jgi:hypothetical protein
MQSELLVFGSAMWRMDSCRHRVVADAGDNSLVNRQTNQEMVPHVVPGSSAGGPPNCRMMSYLWCHHRRVQGIVEDC